MKESMSSFDISAVVKEMQALVGGRIEKVYHPSLDQLVLSAKVPGEKKVFVHFRVGRWLYVSEKGLESPGPPSDFAMMLRKRITNARILEVKQQGFDRIVALELEKEGHFDLILELFGDGNVILVENGTIVQPLTSHTWKHRDVRARKPFLFPPAIPDPMLLSNEDLLSLIWSSDTDIVRTLATKLNMGGRYSEEICARVGLDKGKKAREIDLEGAEAILDAVRGFRGEIEGSGKGYIYLRFDVPEDVTPTKLVVYRDLAVEDHETYSAAVERYIPRIPAPVKQKPKESVLEIERLKRKLTQQESAVIKLQEDVRRTQELGDFVFANYADVAKAIVAAKELQVSGGDMKDFPGFVSFSPKDSILKLAIGGREVALDIRGTVESNAQKCYEEAKRARRKLDGVLIALMEAKKSLDGHTKEHSSEAERPQKRRAPTKKFWFERFRWFISSEGAVVLGGKDARSNDVLVRKHLEAGDRYAHADVHGAPSVVVKMREGVTEKTLHEACEYAVATSKAWTSKIGSAAGYWVLPEQVSKTPESGEYLARGAFVIRGKRNYSGKLEILLGVGEIEYEGHRKVMCAPVSAIKKHSRRYAIIRPGDVDKNEAARKLAEAFDVPIEEVQSILPPGDVEVVEQVGLSISL
jgi:predicted ribosome quality control (RQC) complex YloA/Tae2 family protein